MISESEGLSNNSQTEVIETSKKNNALGIGLAILLAITTFFVGLQIGSTDNSKNSNAQAAGVFSVFSNTPIVDNGVNMDEFWRVWNLMDQKFAYSSTTEIITDKDKLQGAIDGMVRSYGDPYTVYLPPKEAASFDEDISGNFSGVGMEVGIRNNVVTIISPLPETPAEKAGLLAGDIIVQIDGVTTERMSIDEAVQLIRGEKGTEVVLTIYREGETEFREIPVTRDNITIPTIETELRDDVFIIKLYSFNAIAEMKMQLALREYVESDATKLILDLRGNPGGFLQSAVAISSYFLPTGKVIVRESFADKEDQIHRSSGKTLGYRHPEKMVILINRGSASASEILAGALSEHDVATLIGQTSFGKGSVQELVKLPDNSSLKVTIARWLTPLGTSISDGGLKPDYIINVTEEDRLNAIDPQLESAIIFLNGGDISTKEIVAE